MTLADQVRIQNGKLDSGIGETTPWYKWEGRYTAPEGVAGSVVTEAFEFLEDADNKLALEKQREAVGRTGPRVFSEWVLLRFDPTVIISIAREAK